VRALGRCQVLICLGLLCFNILLQAPLCSCWVWAGARAGTLLCAMASASLRWTLELELEAPVMDDLQPILP